MATQRPGQGHSWAMRTGQRGRRCSSSGRGTSSAGSLAGPSAWWLSLLLSLLLTQVAAPEFVWNGSTTQDLPPSARRVSTRGGSELVHEIEWRVPVGCEYEAACPRLIAFAPPRHPVNFLNSFPRSPCVRSFSGFFVEVVCGYLPFLLERGLQVHLLQGRCPEHFLMHKLQPNEAAAYRAAQVEDNGRTVSQTAHSIAIEHAEPCKMRQFSGAKRKGRPRYVISRSMSEGILPAAEVRCANERADEIWVPTKYHSRIFKRSGVSKPRVTVIPESVDVDFFNPDAVDLMTLACHPGVTTLAEQQNATASSAKAEGDDVAAELPRGRYTGEQSSTAYCQRWLRPPPMWLRLPKAENGLAALLPSWRTAAVSGLLPLDPYRVARSSSADGGDRSSAVQAAQGSRPYAFLSVFKWEWRKGWDVLLNAYWGEFTKSDNVVLRLRTFKPHWEPGHENIIDWLKVAATQRGKTLGKLPPVEIVQRELSREELRWLYAASDAFVLPTRGEGWCLPAMEAMSMALPVILTNASGTTEYLTRKNSLPLGFTRTHADGKVEPDVNQLMRLMRSAVRYPGSAAKRGVQARLDIVARYHPRVVAAGLEARLKNIERGLDDKEGEHEERKS